MNIKDIEKIFNMHKEADACIFAIRDSKKHSIKIEGTYVEVMYLFAQLVRSLNKSIPTSLLKIAFQLGFEDEEEN